MKLSLLEDAMLALMLAIGIHWLISPNPTNLVREIQTASAEMCDFVPTTASALEIISQSSEVTTISNVAETICQKAFSR